MATSQHSQLSVAFERGRQEPPDHALELPMNVKEAEEMVFEIWWSPEHDADGGEHDHVREVLVDGLGEEGPDFPAEDAVD